MWFSTQILDVTWTARYTLWKEPKQKVPGLNQISEISRVSDGVIIWYWCWTTDLKKKKFKVRVNVLAGARFQDIFLGGAVQNILNISLSMNYIIYTCIQCIRKGYEHKYVAV